MKKEKKKKRIEKKEVNPARRSVETMQPSEGHFFGKTNNLLHFINKTQNIRRFSFILLDIEPYGIAYID